MRDSFEFLQARVAECNGLCMAKNLTSSRPRDHDDEQDRINGAIMGARLDT